MSKNQPNAVLPYLSGTFSRLKDKLFRRHADCPNFIAMFSFDMSKPESAMRSFMLSV